MKTRQEISDRLVILKEQRKSLDPIYKEFLVSFGNGKLEDFLVALPQYEKPVIVTTAIHQTDAAISSLEWALE